MTTKAAIKIPEASGDYDYKNFFSVLNRLHSAGVRWALDGRGIAAFHAETLYGMQFFAPSDWIVLIPDGAVKADPADLETLSAGDRVVGTVSDEPADIWSCVITLAGRALPCGEFTRLTPKLGMNVPGRFDAGSHIYVPSERQVWAVTVPEWSTA